MVRRREWRKIDVVAFRLSGEEEMMTGGNMMRSGGSEHEGVGMGAGVRLPIGGDDERDTKQGSKERRKMEERTRMVCQARVSDEATRSR